MAHAEYSCTAEARRIYLEDPKLSRSRSAKPPARSVKPPRAGGGSWGFRSRPQSALVSARDGPVSASSRVGDLQFVTTARQQYDIPTMVNARSQALAPRAGDGDHVYCQHKAHLSSKPPRLPSRSPYPPPAPRSDGTNLERPPQLSASSARDGPSKEVWLLSSRSRSPKPPLRRPKPPRSSSRRSRSS